MSIKTKLFAIATSLIGVMALFVSNTFAVLIGTGSVTLESSDLTTITNGATFGVSTQFESLKLIGVISLLSAVAWLLSKVFSSIKIGWGAN